MQANKTPSLYELLSNNCDGLGNLYKKSLFIQNMQNKLSDHFGSPLNEHCMLADYAANILTIHADSPTWATKLRYCTPDILEYMQHECRLTTLKTIRIKVVPSSKNPLKAPTRRLTLSKKASKLIHNVADSMTDQGLRSALLKLTRHND